MHGEVGRTLRTHSMVVTLKEWDQWPRVRQYPLKPEAIREITPVLARLLDQGLIRPGRSACHTPSLPVKKVRSEEYRFVQDLRPVNEATQNIHHVVRNPYALLTRIPSNSQFDTVLDLKDIFLYIPRNSKEIFAFNGRTQKLTTSNDFVRWSVLPQEL